MGRLPSPPDRPDGPKRPPTGSNEPFRVTRPRIAPPPPLPPRPPRGKPTLDDKQAELVRAYVEDESEPPPPSDPEPSFQSSARDFGSSESTPPPPRGRMVELAADMTIRPRRSLHQKFKEWGETISHAQKIIVAVSVIGATVGPFVYRSMVEPGVVWVRTRASVADAEAAGKKACLALLEAKVDVAAVDVLRAEVADAGAQQGGTWDKQDEINAHVHKELSRLRLQTPPPALGPKGKAAGKH
ncbi:MAG TPA: hypothetical protein VK550_12360 [Polyangiaceae bacterium]|nr:hypothetical protein [Polyangiaceae bacterium]